MREAPFGPGLGDTQRDLLRALKRRGPSTLAELRSEMTLAPATLREHLQALVGMGLVERHGTRRHPRGRPEVVYRLGAGGEQLFPHADTALLHDLVRFLESRGQGALLAEFFDERATAPHPEEPGSAIGPEGQDQLAEAARLLLHQCPLLLRDL